jgi:hypothetical protein
MTKYFFETKTNIFFTQKMTIFMTKHMNRNQNYNKCENRGAKNFYLKKCPIKCKFTTLTLDYLIIVCICYVF